LPVSHGDLSAALAAIDQFRKMSDEQRQVMGNTARQVLSESLSQSQLCGQFCDAVESAMGIKQ
jgi:hypothetical protein